MIPIDFSDILQKNLMWLHSNVRTTLRMSYSTVSTSTGSSLSFISMTCYYHYQTQRRITTSLYLTVVVVTRFSKIWESNVLLSQMKTTVQRYRLFLHMARMAKWRLVWPILCQALQKLVENLYKLCFVPSPIATKKPRFKFLTYHFVMPQSCYEGFNLSTQGVNWTCI